MCNSDATIIMNNYILQYQNSIEFISQYHDNYYVIVIPQYKYNILVITQVQGKAEDAGDD